MAWRAVCRRNGRRLRLAQRGWLWRSRSLRKAGCRAPHIGYILRTLLSVYSIAEMQRVFDEELPTTKVGALMNAAPAPHQPVDAESKADPGRMDFPIDSPGGPPPPSTHHNRFISAPGTPPAHHTAHRAAPLAVVSQITAHSVVGGCNWHGSCCVYGCSTDWAAVVLRHGVASCLLP